MQTPFLPPLLMTSCALPNAPSTALHDQDQHIKFTIKSIREWLKVEPKIQLIICDVSNFDFGLLTKKYFPDTQIECLKFHNSSDLVRKFGKGFGEGEIVEYALEHSKILKTCDYFAKCTAKLWVRNFHECLQDWNGEFVCDIHCSNVMKLKSFILNHLDTCFYVSSKRFYNEQLSKVHTKVNENPRQLPRALF